MTMPTAGSSSPAVSMLPSLVRTLIPWLAGVIIVGVAKIGLDLDEGSATTAAQLVVAAIYYAVVRLLETKGNARWGWLLGLAKAPAYSAASAPSPEAPQEVLQVEAEPAVTPAPAVRPGAVNEAAWLEASQRPAPEPETRPYRPRHGTAL